DVDALDLAAVREVAGDLGLRVVEHLALQERLQLRPGLAAPARLFLALALGALALLLLALGADGVSLGEVDVLALAGLAAGAATAIATARLRGRVGRIAAVATRRLGPLRPRCRLRRGLEAQAEQLVAQGIGHGGCSVVRRRWLERGIPRPV